MIPEIAAATIRIMIIGSASSPKNLFKREVFFPFSSSFFPNLDSLCCASPVDSPCSEEFCSFKTSSQLDRYSFILPPFLCSMFEFLHAFVLFLRAFPNKILSGLPKNTACDVHSFLTLLLPFIIPGFYIFKNKKTYLRIPPKDKSRCFKQNQVSRP